MEEQTSPGEDPHQAHGPGSLENTTPALLSNVYDIGTENMYYRPHPHLFTSKFYF